MFVILSLMSVPGVCFKEEKPKRFGLKEKVKQKFHFLNEECKIFKQSQFQRPIFFFFF